MRLWEIIIVAIGLALDSFTVAVCRGSTQGNLKKSTAVISWYNIWSNSNN